MGTYSYHVLRLLVSSLSLSLSFPTHFVIAPRGGHPAPARDQGLRLRLRLRRLPAERQRDGLGRLLRHARGLPARHQGARAGRHAARHLPGETAIINQKVVGLFL